ncbi:MAG: response regulator transcription factor [Clostridia bacterium]|nr:response regulator transcription factor [Clostridia bacterium]
MVNILLVEDEKELNDILKTYLESEGYNVYQCFNGEEGLKAYNQNKIDLVLSDIMMPVVDGFKLAESIRNEDASVPIIFISAKDDKLSKKFGYKLLIDDYIVKPFDIDEVLMKIKALLRRANIEQTKLLTVGNLTMDVEEHTAYIDGKEANFTVREFDILYRLLSYPKKTFTRSKLMEEFWDFDSSATSRTVDVYVAKLREKTEQCHGFSIVTVHGLGYKAVLK